MGDKVFEQVTDYIDAMAAKLGVASEYVFEILVRQAFASGIAKTVVGVALLLAVIGVIKLSHSVFTKAEYDRENYRREPINLYAKIKDELDEMIIAAIILVVGTGAIISMFFLFFGTLHVINPEYYAIKEILSAVKGGG